VDLERSPAGLPDAGAVAKGQIDAAYCWFNHAIYGAAARISLAGGCFSNDAPG